MKVIFFLNNNLNFILLKKNNNKYIIIYNKLNNIYIKYKFNLNVNIHFFKNLRYILIELNYFTLYNNNQLNLLLNKQIKSVNFYFINKIIFFGKGFKIKKFKNKTLSLFFNKSHINFIKWNNIIIKKLKKTKILICSSNFNYTQNIIKTIVGCRKLNIFTKKGLRLSRQLIYKKVGKKTT